MPLTKYILTLTIGLFFFMGSCHRQQPKKGKKIRIPPKELIIYCENSMLNMVLDLKYQFEQQHNCKVIIQNDCSKNLMGIINYAAKGDIYIPSSSSSFKHFKRNTGYQLTDSLFLGYNHLVYMVKKGNPKKFNGSTNPLKRKGRYAIIIANPETSSLGYETKQFLQRQNAYDDVLESVVSLTSDSKGLVKGLIGNQADVAVNWQSDIHVNGNSDHIEIVNPQSPYNNAIPMYAAVISCSTEPLLARAFLHLASQELSESALSRYGFTKRPTIIF
ncbi:substrate-binding domain-containing protein [Carboxylicivirga sediminis]|uniref:Substrate-binding domain-containing protein n=1 Tax=Carboxylicivirga sediminis TaxID=2006564 RepID=A0A941F420_9BACT|nr:substrate-binding domain-containing protein [Carboxylicivirga sediminis]MBR8535579.1 substrate-binding domain-containing protein [Carboxylicivirga sediminis]